MAWTGLKHPGGLVDLTEFLPLGGLVGLKRRATALPVFYYMRKIADCQENFQKGVYYAAFDQYHGEQHSTDAMVELIAEYETEELEKRIAILNGR